MIRKIFLMLLAVIIAGCMMYDADAFLIPKEGKEADSNHENTEDESIHENTEDDSNHEYTFEYKIGDTVNDSAGGVVYYVADGKDGRPLGFTFYSNETDTVGTTAYYLVAALGNFTAAYTWFPSSSNGTEIPGTLKVIGSGMKNTRLIITIMGNPSGDYAAARAYNLKEIDTWFLPSIDELSLLLESKISMLNLDSLNSYWSSSQSSIYESFYFLKNENDVFIQSIDGYNATHYIRPIRAF